MAKQTARKSSNRVDWMTEEEVRNWAEKYGVKTLTQYREAFREAGVGSVRLPNQSEFRRLYGKTVVEALTGAARQKWATEAQVKKWARKNAVESIAQYTALFREEGVGDVWLPWPGNFPSVYGKTFLEVVRGSRIRAPRGGQSGGFMSEEELKGWARENDIVSTKQYRAATQAGGGGCRLPDATSFSRRYGKSCLEVLVGRERPALALGYRRGPRTK